MKVNCVIPFESKVKFSYPVSEILSISLEHEITKNSEDVLGNFLVSGTYKEHELSVNVSDFKFTIPFQVDLPYKIDPDTFTFYIDNFTYELKDNEMLIFIDYIVNAKEAIEVENVEDIEDPLEMIVDVRNEENIINDIQENVVIEKINTENEKPKKEEEVKEDRLEDTEVIKNINSLSYENDYMTYHVHVVKLEESLESISALYNISKEEILHINNLDEIVENDKLLIPIIDE